MIYCWILLYLLLHSRLYIATLTILKHFIPEFGAAFDILIFCISEYLFPHPLLFDDEFQIIYCRMSYYLPLHSRFLLRFRHITFCCIQDYCWLHSRLLLAAFQNICWCCWVLFIAAFQVLVMHLTLYFAESSIIYCRIAHNLLLF